MLIQIRVDIAYSCTQIHNWYNQASSLVLHIARGLMEYVVTINTGVFACRIQTDESGFYIVSPFIVNINS